MQKLKANVIDRMIAAGCTSAEVNLVLHISHYQDDSGLVTGIYYKDIMDALDISDQTFYNALKSLEKKQIIDVEREYYADCNIRIVNNDFTDMEFKENYLKTSYKLFEKSSFLKMKSGEKLLAMLILKMDAAAWEKGGSVKIGVERFYELYSAKFGVSKRILQRYLTTLRAYFSIGIAEGMYRFRPKVQEKARTEASDRSLLAFQIAKTACRRHRIHINSDSFKDLIEVIAQYFSRLKENVAQFINRAIHNSIVKANVNKYIKNPYKYHRELEPAFIHKLLKEDMLVAGI